MVWVPPVNIPQIGAGDYSAGLNAGLSNIGETIFQNQRAAVGDDQWAAEQAQQQANADRNYALELQKIAAGGTGSQESMFGNTFVYADPNSLTGYGRAGVTNRGAVVPLPAPGGEVNVPAGPKSAGGAGWMPRSMSTGWLPDVTYQDAGNQLLPVARQGGGYVGQPVLKGGTPPAGYNPGATNAGGQTTYAPGPGTPQDLELNQKRIGAQQSLMSGQQQAQTIFTTIDAMGNALDSGWATGIGGRVGTGINQLTGIPTERSQLDAEIETVRSLTSRDALLSMRLESPTGAAVGNVSDFENRLMAATAGVLDPDRDPEGTKRTLADIKDKWQDFMAAREIAYLANFEGLDAQMAYYALDAIKNNEDPQIVLQAVKEQMGGR